MKKKKQDKYVPIVAKVTPEVRDYIKSCADKSNRTMSQEIRNFYDMAITMKWY